MPLVVSCGVRSWWTLVIFLRTSAQRDALRTWISNGYNSWEVSSPSLQQKKQRRRNAFRRTQRPWECVQLHPFLAHFCSSGSMENYVGGGGSCAQPAAHNAKRQWQCLSPICFMVSFGHPPNLSCIILQVKSQQCWWAWSDAGRINI